MKKIILGFGLMVLATQASAESFDGCYLLYQPNVVYPTICLQGTLEEGIGGAGVRLTVFATNTATVKACVKSTSLVMTPEELRFQVNGKDELILKNLDKSEGILKGDAIIGSSTFKFGKLDEKAESYLTKIASEQCQ